MSSWQLCHAGASLSNFGRLQLSTRTHLVEEGDVLREDGTFLVQFGVVAGRRAVRVFGRRGNVGTRDPYLRPPTDAHCQLFRETVGRNTRVHSQGWAMRWSRSVGT